MKDRHKISFFFLLKACYRFKARQISNPEELSRAFKLRKSIYSDLLKWVACNKEQETDLYDKYASHFGVFFNGRIIAYCRLITTDKPTMLENDFKMLIEDEEIRKKKDTAEISRLTLDKEFIGDGRGKIIQAFLYRKIYHWSRKNGINFWYVVVREKFFNNLKANFDCQQIGKTYYFKENDSAIAAIIHLQKSLEFVREKNKLLYWWYK
jgi:N-acyl-L-homoserine lactone synthetase